MIRNRYGYYTGTMYVKDKKTGAITPKEVTFSRDFRGRYLNNAVCIALCCNEVAVLHNLIGNNGEPYAIRVTLQEMLDRNNEKYVSVEKNGYVENIPYEKKVSEIQAVTVKQAADTIISLLDDIYESESQDQDTPIDIDAYTTIITDTLSPDALSFYAMREYPEAVTVDYAISILRFAIEEIINGNTVSREDVYDVLRDGLINWVTIDFGDDEPARANGFAAEKPSRANHKYNNSNASKCMYSGEWDHRQVSFEQYYYGNYVNDNLCERLCKGETVTLQIDENRSCDIVLREVNINGFLKIKICKA